MKVLSFKCPDCSARIKINETDTRAVCEYCGHVLLLKDEARRAVHQFEDEPHFDPQAAHAKLADKISALLAPVADLQRAGNSRPQKSCPGRKPPHPVKTGLFHWQSQGVDHPGLHGPAAIA